MPRLNWINNITYNIITIALRVNKKQRHQEGKSTDLKNLRQF